MSSVPGTRWRAASRCPPPWSSYQAVPAICLVVTMMTEGRGFSNAKAKRELGWQLRYPSWRQGFKEGLA